MSYHRLTIFLFACFADSSLAAASDTPRPPNILLILCDDLGYGDVHALDPEHGKIATPNVDRLATQGLIFTDAPGSSSVCTPTRYSLLTGRYNWRSKLQSGVLFGFSKPLIEPGRLTVPGLLKQHGYHTACLGKWHLGLDIPASEKAAGQEKPRWPQDYSQPIKNGPTAHGFDYFYGISASLDMPPYVFIENDRFTAVPSVEKTWIRKGPAAADFEAVDVLPKLTKKAIGYLEERAPTKQPFFLYLALNSPHTPILPTPEWKGRSGINAYADFVMETDAAVGDVLKAVDRLGLNEDTLVIFSSDNGCSPSANISQLTAKGHWPNSIYRGHKADIWDGGHRIPFIARWPGQIKPGGKCDQLLCLGDLLATCAAIVGAKLPDNAGEDSVNLLPALLGTAEKPLREAIVHHSIEGRFAIRQGNWKLELCPGSGGWSDPLDVAAAKQGLPAVQLYDLSSDVRETTNVQAEHPEIVERLTKLLEKYVADGRSTPGQPQANDAKIDIWKKQIDQPKKAKPDAAAPKGD